MLQVKSISKEYTTGELVQAALSDVSLNLRDNEFVAILGPSGSGKTTLLNIIGGLDRYDSGDLIINGISTKKYKDRDWDSYRNHTIGFVFQSYNLIPHQSILSNVELALTIGGISRAERKKRATKALEEVGLGDQLHKKPNQMSGGQMQRVAIARALVNDPDILLADEPTGALDTETSIQVMELLKQVAKDRLVVMVTHNPELAQQYATRIVRLRDGKITDDSNPFTPKEPQKEPEHRNLGKARMSFGTALALSFNNLKTKKGRTLLTAFAGSIGIIGIALILSLSTGVNTYINDIQKETMTSYPITISAETIDMSSMMNMQGSSPMGNLQGDKTETEKREGVYIDNSQLKRSETFASSITENDLTAFKAYLEDPDSEIQNYLGGNGVLYHYNVAFDVYAYDEDDQPVNTDADTEELSGQGSSTGGFMGNSGMMQMMLTGSISSGAGAENFSQLMQGTDDDAVSQVLRDNYDMLYGTWPQAYDEIILVLSENNTLSTETMYQLGLITADRYLEIQEQLGEGEEPQELSISYADICDRNFYLVPANRRYTENEDGTFSEIGGDIMGTEQLLENSIELKITGVIRPVEDASVTLSTAVGYTAALTDYLITETDNSDIVKAQEKTPEVNVLSGMAFTASSDEKKAEDATEYISNLSISEKASLYTMIRYTSMQNSDAAEEAPAQETGEQEPGMDEAAQQQAMEQMQQMQGNSAATAATDETAMATALDQWLVQTPDLEILVSLYDQYIGGASFEGNMENFGKVSYDAPSSISIYTDSFEDKDAVSRCISDYNKTVDEGKQITYTDYVALLTSSITSIVDAISYVLIAFVAVSLIVSSIMIGIITHISVMERTKEIGILRALGASKSNISQVFNAETIIIGLCSGTLGVGISVLLTFPINSIIRQLLGASTLTAALPLASGAILVAISIIITVIGGMLPAKSAAKKDPVTALRTE